MRELLSKGVSLNIKALRYGLRQLMRLDQYLNKGFNKAAHDKGVIQSTCRYDMVSAADEGYFLDQYWFWIEQFLESKKVLPNGVFLDAGCGHGRLSIPFAKWCKNKGFLTAVDLSEPAIQSAKKNAANEQLDNIEFIQSDILNFLKKITSNSFDGVFLLEIVFFLPNYEEVLSEIVRVLKPGGFFIGSFRSQYFNLLHSMRNGLWHSIDMILKQRRGSLVGGAMQFNWHKRSELEKVLQSLALEINQVIGIGACSGIPGDPHDFVRPGALTLAERSLLMSAEKNVAESLPEAGRYILILSRLKS